MLIMSVGNYYLSPIKQVNDLIRSIGETHSLAVHLRSLARKKKQSDKKTAEQLVKLVLRLRDLRAKKQQYLLDGIEKLDGDYWCAIKHSLQMTAFDDELADSDIEYTDIADESAKIMSEVFACATGDEIVPCSECQLDRMVNAVS